MGMGHPMIECSTQTGLRGLTKSIFLKRVKNVIVIIIYIYTGKFHVSSVFYIIQKRGHIMYLLLHNIRNFERIQGREPYAGYEKPGSGCKLMM